jgi:hypothetical protein
MLKSDPSPRPLWASRTQWAPSAHPTHTRWSTITRTIGALALLVVGGVHYQQYHYAFYSSIPTIGPLFLANSVAATTLGLFLLSPVRPLRRLGPRPDQLAALAGVALAGGAFAGLLISEHTSLFGFREHGYRFAIVLALASEVVVIAMLVLFLWSERISSQRGRVTSAQRHAGTDSGNPPAEEDPVAHAATTPHNRP